MAAPEVTLYAKLEGLAQVTAGFTSIGNAAAEMGRKAQESGDKMEVSYKRLALTTAGLIANSVQLGDIMHRMATGQMDVGRGALMLTMNFLQLAAQLTVLDAAYKGVIASKITAITLNAREIAGDISAAAAKGIHTAAVWAHVIAEKARAVAHAIANALAGPAGWVILAGAAIASAGALALAASIPSRLMGGYIPQTGPYMLHAGEYVVPRGNSPITINIYGGGSPRETGDAVVDALRRAGAI